MRVVWLAVNASYAHSSLAAPLLHAAAQGRVQSEWHLVQVTMGDDPALAAAQVAKLAPDICAATLYLFTREAALAMLARVKALCPDCCIIVGGPELAGECELLLRSNPWIDIGVRGEGERIFPDWLDRWQSPERWADLPGLCWIDDNGAWHDNGVAIPVDPLEQLPSPLTSPFHDSGRAFVQMETSRGCIHHCSFCANGGGGAMRLLPLSRIQTELEELARRGVREVRLLDRTFNAHPSRCVDLLRLFRRFPSMRFHLEFHPALLPPAVRDELAAMPSGQLHFDVGLQSTSPEVLTACSRGGSPERAWEGLRWLVAQRNLAIHVDLIAGLPELTLPYLEADVRRLVELGPEEIQLESLKLLPGTRLRTEAKQYGLIYSPLPPYEVLSTRRMSMADLRAAALLSTMIDRFYNTPVIQPVLRAAQQEMEELLPSLRHWLTQQQGLELPCSLEKRMLLLYTYLEAHRLPAREMLCRQWMWHGLPPGRCPVEVRTWKGALPTGGEWLIGSQADAASGSARVRRLRLHDVDLFYIFDLGREPQKSVALYHMSRTEVAQP